MADTVLLSYRPQNILAIWVMFVGLLLFIYIVGQIFHWTTGMGSIDNKASVGNVLNAA